MSGSNKPYTAVTENVLERRHPFLLMRDGTSCSDTSIIAHYELELSPSQTADVLERGLVMDASALLFKTYPRPELQSTPASMTLEWLPRD